MDAQAVVTRMGGVARRSELLEVVGRTEFERAVAAREIRRSSRGIYVSRFPDQARLIAREAGGVLSHLAAARRWSIGLTVPLEHWDVTVPRNAVRRSRPARARLHYRDIPADDIADDCTSVLRTVLDCLRTAPVHLALAVLESAAESQRVEMAEVRARVADFRGPGSGQAQRILSWYDPRACPPLESALRGTLLDAGVDSFQPQFEVWDGDRKVATTDLGDPETGTLLEADSFLNHGSRDQLAKDAARYNELVSRGYRVLRFTYPPIAAGSPWVVKMVRRTLAVREK